MTEKFFSILHGQQRYLNTTKDIEYITNNLKGNKTINVELNNTSIQPTTRIFLPQT